MWRFFQVYFSLCVLQSPKKIGDDIAKGTADWKGLKITVKLVVQNRQAKVEVVPSASSLLIKSLKEPPRDRKKVKHGKYMLEINFHCTPKSKAPLFWLHSPRHWMPARLDLATSHKCHIKLYFALATSHKCYNCILQWLLRISVLTLFCIGYIA